MSITKLLNELIVLKEESGWSDKQIIIALVRSSAPAKVKAATHTMLNHYLEFISRKEQDQVNQLPFRRGTKRLRRAVILKSLKMRKQLLRGTLDPPETLGECSSCGEDYDCDCSQDNIFQENKTDKYIFD